MTVRPASAQTEVKSLIMSFLAATSSTSICPAASAWGVRICVSMFTSFTSKGMYCSASHWMDSSRSSWDMTGMEMRLMMTEWPRTPMATSFDLDLLLGHQLPDGLDDGRGVHELVVDDGLGRQRRLSPGEEL